jgi:hypothetical protein
MSIRWKSAVYRCEDGTWKGMLYPIDENGNRDISILRTLIKTTPKFSQHFFGLTKEEVEKAIEERKQFYSG